MSTDKTVIRIPRLKLNDDKKPEQDGDEFVFLLKDVLVLQSSPGYNFTVEGRTLTFPAILYHLGQQVTVVEPLIRGELLQDTFTFRLYMWKAARS